MIDLAQELLKLSENMLSQAKEGAWNLVEQTQAIRIELIQKLEKKPTTSLNPSDSDAVARLILKSRELEKQCEFIVRKSQNGLTSEHSKLSRGKAMQKAYGANRR